MRASIEFNNQLIPQSLIDIEEIGDCALECYNEDGYYWYLIIQTSMGTTAIASCGPVVPDVDLLPSGFAMHYDKMPYKEDKLTKTISYYLNDKSKKLVAAVAIPIEKAVAEFRDLGAYLLNHSEEI